MTILAIILMIALAYLVGGIPSGYLVGRIGYGIDIRRYGSRKTGGTNVARTLGWGAFILVGISDVAKGLIMVLLAVWLFNNPLVTMLTATAAVLGHNWSPYIGFSGGSGVGTAFGGLLVIQPPLAALGGAVWLTIVLTTRYVSLGSLTALGVCALAAIIGVVLGWLPLEMLLFAGIGGGAIVYKHRANIQRLRAGTEHKFGDRVAIETPPGQT